MASNVTLADLEKAANVLRDNSISGPFYMPVHPAHYAEALRLEARERWYKNIMRDAYSRIGGGER